MKHIKAQIATYVLVFIAGTASAKSVTVSVPMSQISTHASARGDFYVVGMTIPAAITVEKLESVVIEFAIDATEFSVPDSVVTPIVGVYPLNESITSENGPQTPSLDSLVPSARPVSVGEHRVLRMNIADIVRAWLENPATNHGLAIGSLTGPEVATVTLNESLPGASAAVRITYFYKE